MHSTPRPHLLILDSHCLIPTTLLFYPYLPPPQKKKTSDLRESRDPTRPGKVGTCRAPVVTLLDHTALAVIGMSVLAALFSLATAYTSVPTQPSNHNVAVNDMTSARTFQIFAYNVDDPARVGDRGSRVYNRRCFALSARRRKRTNERLERLLGGLTRRRHKSTAIKLDKNPRRMKENVVANNSRCKWSSGRVSDP